MLGCVRITALIPEAIVNSIYRSLVPMQALAYRGHSIHVEERNEIVDGKLLFESDVVHFLRFNHRPMIRMARALREAGVAVVWDNDDNLMASQRGNPNYRHHSGLRGQALFTQMTAMMRAAHIVTTPSTFLADLYERASGAEVRLMPNHLPPTFTRPERVMPHAGVRVLWVGALEHQRDDEQLAIRSVLERMLIRHQHVEVGTVGLNLGLTSHRYSHFGIIPYGELAEIIANYDIAIAPIAESEFNRGRSDVKLKEYAAAGTPWLASPIGPYAGMGEEQGGRLVADDAWYEELERLILDPDDRRRLGRRGRMWAQGETIDAHVEEWEQLFEDAVERARSPHAVG